MGMKLRRLLLLAYSVSPAASKLLGVEALFGAGLLFLAGYFALCRVEASKLAPAFPPASLA